MTWMYMVQVGWSPAAMALYRSRMAWSGSCLATCSTAQYSTVQYSTVQHSTVQYSAVQYSTVQYSTACHLVGLLAGEGAMALVRLVVELAVHRLAGTVHHLEGVGAVAGTR